MNSHRNEGEALAGLMDPTEEVRMSLGESERLGKTASWEEIGESLEKRGEPQRDTLRQKLARMKGLSPSATWKEISMK